MPLWLILMVHCLGAGAGLAAEVEIQNLLLQPDRYWNVTVTVVGQVVSTVANPPGTTRGLYELQDESSPTPLRVRSVNLPPMGKVYEVSGTVIQDPGSPGRPLLREVDRGLSTRAIVPLGGTAPVPPPAPPAASVPGTRATGSGGYGTGTPSQPSQPFGLRLGSTLPEIEAAIGGRLSDSDQGIFFVTTPPRPHAAFARYEILVTPATGLCRIRAMGSPVTTDSSGAELRRRFDAMRGQLASSYGTPAQVDDALDPQSPYTRPEDWMTALATGDRLSAARWSGATLLQSSGLLSVTLELTAPWGPATGRLELTYRAPRAEECEIALHARGGNVF